MSIHILTGISTAGINLSLTNIGLKLAPHNDAMMYLAAKNMITGLFSAAAPLTGGLLADFFSNQTLNWNVEWQGATGVKTIHLLNLHHWNFFFITGAILSLLSLRLLKLVKEDGEVARTVVITNMRYNFNDASGKAIKLSAAHFRAIPANLKKGFYYINIFKRSPALEKKRV